jgi:hypothetical protein
MTADAPASAASLTTDLRPGAADRPRATTRNLTLADWAARADAEPPFEPGDLLEMAWCLIANAATRLIDDRTDEWGICARRWRAGYHATLSNPAPAEPTNTCQADADAARYWAGEVWRLQTGLGDLGVAVDGPVNTAAVDTALRVLADRLAPPTTEAAPAPAEHDRLPIAGTVEVPVFADFGDRHIHLGSIEVPVPTIKISAVRGS